MTSNSTFNSDVLVVSLLRLSHPGGPSIDSDIFKVGAGPAGLVLALSLLKNGIRVRVIEKDEAHHHGERGPGVMVSERARSYQTSYLMSSATYFGSRALPRHCGRST